METKGNVGTDDKPLLDVPQQSLETSENAKVPDAPAIQSAGVAEGHSFGRSSAQPLEASDPTISKEGGEVLIESKVTAPTTMQRVMDWFDSSSENED
jgi:hypothetical protein